MGALLGDDVVEAGPGDLVFKPRDQWHTFWNAGDEPCRILEIISPAGFEQFFRELDAPGRRDPRRPRGARGAQRALRAGDAAGVGPGLLERFGLRIGEQLTGGWTPPVRSTPDDLAGERWRGLLHERRVERRQHAVGRSTVVLCPSARSATAALPGRALRRSRCRGRAASALHRLAVDSVGHAHGGSGVSRCSGSASNSSPRSSSAAWSARRPRHAAPSAPRALRASTPQSASWSA